MAYRPQVLTVANGGTGAITLTSHGVLIGSGTSAVAATAAGSSGQVLRSGGASADPAYSTATYPASSAQGDIFYSSAANTYANLAKDTNATRYLSNTGTTNNPAWAQVALSTGVSGTLPLANGGLNTTAITGLVAGSGSAYAGRTITGTANQISVANGDGASANPTLSLTSTIYTNISFDSGSNTLSAYAAGTWTPTITSNGTPPTVTYGVQRGTYVKIGTFCYLSALITLATYSGGTGQLQIGSLPFNAPADLNFPLGAASLSSVAYLGAYTCAQIQDTGGTTFIQFTQSATASANATITVDKFTAASIFNFSVCYRTV